MARRMGRWARKYSAIAVTLVVVLGLTSGCAFLAALGARGYAEQAKQAAFACLNERQIEAAIKGGAGSLEEAAPFVGTLFGIDAGAIPADAKRAADAALAAMLAAIANGDAEAAARAAMAEVRADVAANCECDLADMRDEATSVSRALDHVDEGGNSPEKAALAAFHTHLLGVGQTAAAGTIGDPALARTIADGVARALVEDKDLDIFRSAARGGAMSLGADALSAEAGVEAAMAERAARKAEAVQAEAQLAADAVDAAAEAEAASRLAGRAAIDAKLAGERHAGFGGNVTGRTAAKLAAYDIGVDDRLADAIANAPTSGSPRNNGYLAARAAGANHDQADRATREALAVARGGRRGRDRSALGRGGGRAGRGDGRGSHGGQGRGPRRVRRHQARAHHQRGPQRGARHRRDAR